MSTHPRRLRAPFQELVARLRPATVSLASLAAEGGQAWAVERARAVPRVQIGLLAAMSFLLLLPLIGAAPAEASSATISGTAFQDLNRDGLQQADEPPFVDHVIYLYNSSGTLIDTSRTDADGRYSFSVSPGTYRVAYMPSSWREIWNDWVPTNTEGLTPEHTNLSPGDVADFAWRPVETSTTTPLSDFTGPSGLRVQSYNDVITARELHDHIASEFLVTSEAPTTTVRFARSSNVTSTIFYEDHTRSTVNVTYRSWLQNEDRMLAHEYGHAWTNHHMHVNWRDDWEAYLAARDLADDDRVGSSYNWLPHEIAAEDYRQLFASENARSGGQMNTSIPRPWEIDGFAEWMRWTFTNDAAASEPEEGTDTDVDPEPEPTPDPEDEPDEGKDDDTSNGDPEDGQEDGEVSPAVSLEVDSWKTRGRNVAQLSWDGAQSEELDVYLNGANLASVPNSGSWTHETGTRGNPTHVYRVCETDGGDCSDAVTVSDW